MSSEFFMTKLCFFIFFFVFFTHRTKKETLCTIFKTKFFIYAQHNYRVAQLETCHFGQDDDFSANPLRKINPRIREDVLHGWDV